MKRTKEIYQKLIDLINQKQSDIYRLKSKNERSVVRKIDWDRDDDFYVHVEIEAISLVIEGYVFQIVNYGKVSNHEKALNDLNVLNIFENHQLANWYFDNKTQYPFLAQSIELLDYLRRIVLEYLLEYSEKGND